MPLLEIDNLSVSYKTSQRTINAVRRVSFSLNAGEILGLVGESGCGKTTIGKAIIGLTNYTSGSIYFEGKKLNPLNPHKEIQMVFQDPYSSLNPRMTIKEILLEPLQVYKIGTKKEKLSRVHKLLNQVGIDENYLFSYPHELSGGQRQRICIARALATEPKCIICDEPIAALDVSIQAQVINLLKQLQKELGLAYLFISHDLAVVKHICERVAVMHYGDLVEYGNTQILFNSPKHPYTQALLESAKRNTLPHQERKELLLPI